MKIQNKHTRPVKIKRKATDNKSTETKIVTKISQESLFYMLDAVQNNKKIQINIPIHKKVIIICFQEIFFFI